MQRKVFLPRIATELLDSLEDLIDVLGSVGAVGEERELVEEESAGGDPDGGPEDESSEGGGVDFEEGRAGCASARTEVS